VRLRGSELQVFYSNRCDKPERILKASVRLSDGWTDWRPSEPVEVLAPEKDYEGVNEPHAASRGGAIHQPAWQLRDPAIFEEAGKTYLLYAVAGEHGIAMADQRYKAAGCGSRSRMKAERPCRDSRWTTVTCRSAISSTASWRGGTVRTPAPWPEKASVCSWS
jgi:hypothetical protein